MAPQKGAVSWEDPKQTQIQMDSWDEELSQPQLPLQVQGDLRLSNDLHFTSNF